jgi:REP element-mobilizing transposase RayT
MVGPPVSLDLRDAAAIIAQYQETCRIRGWELEAASVMFNHTHLVVGVVGDPKPQDVLNLFKSWATRCLKKHGSLPPNGDFWTENGSRRKLADERAIRDGVIYVVRRQPNPLAVWLNPKWQMTIDDYEKASRTPYGVGLVD